MTVKDLKNKIADLPDNMPVMKYEDCGLMYIAETSDIECIEVQKALVDTEYDPRWTITEWGEKVRKSEYIGKAVIIY